MSVPSPERPIRDHYSDRVTIDLDSKGYGWQMKAIQAYENLGEAADAVDVHVSSSGTGMHFVAYFEDPVPMHEQIAIRRNHHDDKRRIDLEVQRWRAGLPTDILFSQKDGEHGDGRQTKERRFRDVWDALDYIRAQRDDMGRMRSLANHGHKGDAELCRKARRTGT